MTSHLVYKFYVPLLFQQNPYHNLIPIILFNKWITFVFLCVNTEKNIITLIFKFTVFLRTCDKL